jgi:uncharacterized repeat protein (TIGR02543 family)
MLYLINKRLFAVLTCLVLLSMNPLSGQALTLTSTGQTGTSGSNWSLSSNTITVTGNADINVSVINNHLSGNSLTITGASTITQSAAISWSTNQTLTLRATGNITINNTITATGSAAGLNLYFGGSNASTAPTAGTFYALVQRSRSKIQLTGLNPQLRIGNTLYTVYNSLSALSTAMASSTSATRAALGSDITLSQTYSSSVFDITFQGIFDGLGNVIDGLTIRNSGGASTKNNLGLFSQFQGATVRNLGITNINIQTSSTAADATGSEYRIGGLVGNVGNSSLSTGYSNTAYTTTIEGVWSSGNISTANNFGTDNVSSGDRQKFYFAGGIVGSHNNGTMNLTRSYSTANVSTAGSYTDNLGIGGLVGDIGINTSILQPHAIATSSQLVCTINKSFTTGSLISGTYNRYYGTGGVVGVVFTAGSTFEDCYSWGSAVSNASFGGLIGWAETGGTIRRSYTTQSTVGAGGAFSSAQNCYNSVTSTSPTTGTTLPTGFGSTEWSKAAGERPILNDLETAPIPLYVRVTTGGSSNFGNLNIAYTIVDASGNLITLATLGLSTPTGTPVFTITNITPAGTYNDVSYITGLTLTGTNAALYTLKPFPTTTPATHTITCPGTCNTYTITYNGNSHTGGAVPSVTTFATSGTIASKGTLVRYGFEFIGWNTAANGSGTNYAEGSTYSTASNLSLFARWRKVPYQVCTYTELTNAITAATDGDTISVNCNIVATAATTISKTLVINGNGYTISVPVPGLDDMGRYSLSPSAFRVFTFTGSKTITINNLTIKGGSISDNGGAINISSTNTVRLNNCTVSNSLSSFGGGGIVNSGVLYLNNSYLRRNAASWGGGILNTGSSRTYVESSTMVENRSTSTSGGGGAAECQSGSIIYFNNSTLSNNQSTEIGGAINNYQGTIYFVNSSATGNVAFGSYSGGAIGNNGGNVHIVNSLFAHNYRRTTGSVTSPTGYVLDDVVAFSAQSNVRMYYSIHHASLPGGMGTTSNNINYTGNADGSNNTIFSGGLLSRITDNSGNEIGDQIFRPFLYENQGSVAPTLKSGSFVSIAGNKGTPTRFSNNNNSSPAIAYYNGTAWVNIIGTSATNQLVTTDQVGQSRSNTAPSRGAIEAELSKTLYIVKVNNSSGGNGTINGGTIYGDVYESGTSLTLTAVPNASYSFTRWDYVSGGTGTASTSNPYIFTVTGNVTLIPVFTSLSAGQYTITYVGNGHTGGTIPTGGTFSGTQTIAADGSMTRDGYKFTGWNTNSNGSGTSYAAGTSYSTVSNLTLFAQWTEILWKGSSSTDFSTASNWNINDVPINSSFAIAHDAVNDLQLSSNMTVNFVKFYNTTRDVILGNNTLTTTSVSGYSADRYIKTNGTGRLKMNVASGASTLYPVGNSAYNPVTITNKNAAADDFSVLVVDEVYENGSSSGTALTQPRVRRTWNINKTNSNTGSGVDFLFNWNSGEVSGTITTARLFHYGTRWAKQTGTSSSTATSFTYTGYTGSFSPFAIGDDVQALPVTLLYFNCHANENKGNLLRWATATELNSKQFEVERSTDGKIYQTIGTISAAGNSLTTRTYEFIDKSTLGNMAAYRLKMIDEDGSFKYSDPCVVLNHESGSNKTLIYPNPSHGSFTIETEAPGQFKIVDAFGRVVKQGDISGKTSISGLMPGVFFITLQTAENRHTQKLVVK